MLNPGTCSQDSQCCCTHVAHLDIVVLEFSGDCGRCSVTDPNEVADSEQSDSPIVIVEIRDTVLFERPIDPKARLINRVEFARPNTIDADTDEKVTAHQN